VLRRRIVELGGREGPGALTERAGAGAGTWSTAGSFAGARSQHSATLLATGKVLLAGGPSAMVQLAKARAALKLKAG